MDSKFNISQRTINALFFLPRSEVQLVVMLCFAFQATAVLEDLVGGFSI